MLAVMTVMMLGPCHSVKEAISLTSEGMYSKWDKIQKGKQSKRGQKGQGGCIQSRGFTEPSFPSIASYPNCWLYHRTRHYFNCLETRASFVFFSPSGVRGKEKREGRNTSWDENTKKRQVSFFPIKKKNGVVGTGRKMCFECRGTVANSTGSFPEPHFFQSSQSRQCSGPSQLFIYTRGTDARGRCQNN